MINMFKEILNNLFLNYSYVWLRKMYNYSHYLFFNIFKLGKNID